jgi:hypothetical protein
LEHFFIFPYIGNQNPNWLIFFRGVETTNQVFEWSCLTDSCWPRSAWQTMGQALQMSLKLASVDVSPSFEAGRFSLNKLRSYQGGTLHLSLTYVCWSILPLTID